MKEVCKNVRDDLGKLKTEGRNQNTLYIDTMSTIEMMTVMNNENRVVEDAIATQLSEISQAVDIIAAALESGGHLIYIGAGTSGRLGVVDASECPPTFGVYDRLVRGIIAGGEGAMFRAVEGAEDDEARGAEELLADGVTAGDVVVGLSASGGAPYVLGALKKIKPWGNFIKILQNIISLYVSVIYTHKKTEVYQYLNSGYARR